MKRRIAVVALGLGAAMAGGCESMTATSPTTSRPAQDRSATSLDANLDRIQIIKGWVDEKGEPHDSVCDVVWSDRRLRDAKGMVAPVSNTVDVTKATYVNSVGSAELMGTWSDKHFDPTQPALYYVRVLQIPTPRWSTYDAVRAGLPPFKERAGDSSGACVDVADLVQAGSAVAASREEKS